MRRLTADDKVWLSIIHTLDMAHADLQPRHINLGVSTVPAGTSNAAKTGGTR